jgi:galactokinase
MTTKELFQAFQNLYGKAAEHIYFCPGRVNLIGEHIDYNGGPVMPCAVNYGTYVLIARNTDQVMRFRSYNFYEQDDLPVNGAFLKRGSAWYNYPQGVVCYLVKQGVDLKEGLDLFYFGNLPIGAGLSSSASIEMVTAFAFNDLFNGAVSRLDLVKLTKAVENSYIGVNSGIMDQFAVTFAEQDKALILDCDSLEYEAVDICLDDHVLAIINTNKPRNLAGSKYNERVRECREALQCLQKELAITELCQIGSEELHANQYLIADETIWKRARHVVEENDRVKLAASALRQGDLKAFGQLMNDSHQSLKELYEVSGKELDTIAEYSRYYRGVAGARMTGAGFGGCAIAIVKHDDFNDYRADLIDFYTQTIGYAPHVYRSAIVSGVGRLSIETLSDA